MPSTSVCSSCTTLYHAEFHCRTGSSKILRTLWAKACRPIGCAQPALVELLLGQQEPCIGVLATMNSTADVRSFAIFHSDFPNDSAERNDQIVVPGGRNILAAICGHLEAHVPPIRPAQHSFYGWTAGFPIGKVNIWLLLQCPDPWLLIVESRASWWTGAKSKEGALLEGINLVSTAIKLEPRLKQVQWMNKAEYEQMKRDYRWRNGFKLEGWIE